MLPVWNDLGKGKCFGAAYLDMVNQHFSDYYNTCALIGAGTLKIDAYKPYVDAKSLTVKGEIGGRNGTAKSFSFFIADTTTFRKAVVQSDAAIRSNTGSVIRLLPEFRTVAGCQMELRIDPRLRDDVSGAVTTRCDRR